MQYDKDLDLGTAREFLDALMGGVFRPTKLFDVADWGATGYVFRGQANREWPLVTLVHRDASTLFKFTPQPPGAMAVEAPLLGRAHVEITPRTLRCPLLTVESRKLPSVC